MQQGVYIEMFERLPLGAQDIKGCRATFSNRSTYVMPRMAATPAHAAQLRANHFDLGCGYSGQYKIDCTATPAEAAQNKCSYKVDISACSPPTYSQALDACYTVPTTTTLPSVTMQTVEDWLGIEEINFTVAQLPTFFNITTQTTTPFPCCEVHVGSVCRHDIDFTYPAQTVQGRWQPSLSYQRSAGYFPVTPCDTQAKSTPRACPRVRLKQLNSGFLQWPHCASACNFAKAEAEFLQICNRTKHPEIEVKEKAAHQKKISSMKAEAAALESWTANRMEGVIESKQVIDCFDDRLPRRYNALSLPQRRSGFDKMPLHNQCRLHGCAVDKCLEVKRQCRVPYVHEGAEVMCNVYRPNGTFDCVDKSSIMTDNPMSFGFGIAWMVIGFFMLCAAIACFIKTLSLDRPSGHGESTALALPGAR
jgi:hypothetical protein